MNINATILGQIISFILFIWFCMKYVWNPLIFIIEQRQKEISDNLAAANYAKSESDRINAEALECLTQARIKAQKIIKQANQCKMQIINDAKYEANQEKNKILCQANIDILYEKNRVIDELRNIIGKLIIQSTEKVIEHSMNEVIDNNIINNIINSNALSAYKE